LTGIPRSHGASDPVPNQVYVPSAPAVGGVPAAPKSAFGGCAPGEVAGDAEGVAEAAGDRDDVDIAGDGETPARRSRRQSTRGWRAGEAGSSRRHR
jgi:hypothetical protein